jgi:hypothetical protein
LVCRKIQVIRTIELQNFVSGRALKDCLAQSSNVQLRLREIQIIKLMVPEQILELMCPARVASWGKITVTQF